ncbi:MAG: proline--tRNA ligase [Betaproteobacteria bacterium RIFCSPHIGHO2_12_FULL_69_13]|nr:MAG: proline--tRNA ligase [Betaproteobacteria bacterium RIFCSPHIGHO2_12_FULL_69_13]OGA70429.1 MAG: proline--tRNA ligase [Betaproteobacteria bacterium RIFCSPLOWO2_12_FULL_68_20]
MLTSRFPLATQKEAPAEAELASHQLMLRAGIIRRLGAGLYTWMPLGLRVLRKVEAIVRDEMNRAGALEVQMPCVIPAELWQESGRWTDFGPQLLKIKDRHERDFLFGPTHEEVITDIARREIRSYRQLPVHFYQMHTKFRDEIRPRFGVMRAREFLMKDGYSFHADCADLEREYRNMYDTYTRIFTRLGLGFRVVAADPGAIGGTGSHEFHVLADSGEDAIAYCPDSDYAANIELAEALAPAGPRHAPTETMRKVDTPGKTRCEEVAAHLGIPLERMVKAIAIVRQSIPYGDPGSFALVLLRGDHDLNELKTQQALGSFRFASDKEIEQDLRCRPGYIGPVKAAGPVAIFADRTVAKMSDFVCGANEPGYHLAGVNWGRDLRDDPGNVRDFRNVRSGDPSPDGKGTLHVARGIEVGHIFQLRTKYSEAMKAVYLDEKGESRPMEMGCYGIGVTRIVAAAIEQNHDQRGIAFPVPMAPFAACLVPIGYHKSERVREAAGRLHGELLAAGIDVLMDDRDERPGVLFADMDLIGIPHRLVLSERGLAAGSAEYKGRRDAKPQDIRLADAVGFLRERLAAA